MHDILRLRPTVFRQLEEVLAMFKVDPMVVSSENAQHSDSPTTDEQPRLPFVFSYNCEGLAGGVDVFRQDVALTPRQATPAFGYCFPPPVMVGHIVQHIPDCYAHAVVVLPDAHEYWAPRVRHATVRELALMGTFGFPHHREGRRARVRLRRTALYEGG